MKMISRRTVLQQAPAVVAAASLFGHTRASAQGKFPDPSDEAALYAGAKAEGQLNWYQNSPLPPMQALLDTFTAKYPGIKTTINRMVSTSQYARFMQETNAGQHVADVMLMGDLPSAKRLIKDGHIAQWRVPTLDKFPAKFVVGDYIIAHYFTENCLIYNTKGMTPEEINIIGSGWDGVLDPRFKGRFTVCVGKTSGGYGPVHMWLDPKYESRWGRKYIEAVGKQKPGLFPDFQVIIDRVVAGEYDFTFMSLLSSGVERIGKKQPIGWVQPSPTPTWGNSWQGISTHAPHPFAARLFHNWCMGPEGALAIEQNLGARSALAGFADSRAVAKEPWFKSPAERYDVDFDRWEAHYETDMNFFIQAMKV